MASIVIGFIYSGVHTGNIFWLSFCQSSVVHQFCDIPSLLRLSCSDTFSNQVVIFISAVVVGGGSFALISCLIFSYFLLCSSFCSQEKEEKPFLPVSLTYSWCLFSSVQALLCIWSQPPTLPQYRTWLFPSSTQSSLLSWTLLSIVLEISRLKKGCKRNF